jgi:hypothetical protein
MPDDATSKTLRSILDAGAATDADVQQGYVLLAWLASDIDNIKRILPQARTRQERATFERRIAVRTYQKAMADLLVASLARQVAPSRMQLAD